jgi:hypothetical protein
MLKKRKIYPFCVMGGLDFICELQLKNEKKQICAVNDRDVTACGQT